MSSPSLIAAWFASIPLASAGAQGEDAARLLPANAAVLVRVESTQAWDGFVRAFAPLGGESTASFSLQGVLDGMADRTRADGAPTPLLDPARPVFLAVALDPASGPALTFVAPVTNGQPFRFHPTFTNGRDETVQLGSYTGVSIAPGYAASASPNPLVAALRPGLVSVHVELATLIATFRPLIDTGLRQAHGMLDQLPQEGPLDMRPLLELYLEGASEFLDSALTLDLVLDGSGDELALQLHYSEREQRRLSAVLPDSSSLLGYVDPDSSIQMLFNGKWSELYALVEDMAEAMLDGYPEPLRADLQRLLSLQRELDPLLLPGLAMGADFGGEGLHGSTVLRSSQPAELVAKLEGLIRALDHEGGLVRVGPSERLASATLEARVLPLTIHFESAWQMIEDAAGAGGTLDPGAKQQFEDAMSSLYGRDLCMALAQEGELVLVCFANDDARLGAELARLRSPATPSARMQRLAARIEPGGLGFAYHLDLGQALGQIFEALRGVLPGASLSFPRTTASLDSWGSVRGATWSGGMSTSRAEFLAFVQAIRALEDN